MRAPVAQAAPSRRVRLPAAAAIVVAAAASLWLAVAASSDAKAPADLASDVGPVVRSHCFACHDAKTHAGDLDLTGFADGSADGTRVRDRIDVWRKVRARVAAREMPPKDAPKLSAVEEDRFLSAMDRAIEAATPPAIPGDPGRVTLRRLNRLEYRNTIRDLFGIDDRSSDGFPSDDVGHGFDRIGDVLSMPPLLFEKYAAAAEHIADQAIVVAVGPGAPARRFEAEKLDFTRTQASAGGGFVNFFTDGAATGEIRLPRDGDYEIRARVFADQAGPEPARLAWRVGEVDVASVDVKAVVRKPEVVVGKFRGVKGVRSFSIAFVNDYYAPDDPDPTKRDRNLHVDWVEIAGPMGVVDDPPESHKRIFARDPGGRDVAARAKGVLAPLASRVWRRPVRADELDRLVGLVTADVKAGAPFEQGVRTALEALLVAPHFLFHVEVLAKPDDPRAIAPLDDYALATRLSYFLWSSLPDDALFARARDGSLRANLAAEVRRMLDDPRAGSLVDGFAEQWLTLRRLAATTPDRERFPSFDARLKDDMLRETQMFFEAVMHEDRSILDFVDGPYTYLNERLAKHYGIAGVAGERFRRVSLEGATRAGIFTQASILTVTSYPTRTSPVRRGKWMLEQVLGQTVAPPPPGAGDLNEGDEATKAASLRTRTEQHRRDPACASCHQKLDPLGFGLENYDAVGAWRERDGAFPIDASGTLPDGRTFGSPREMRAIVKADPGFVRCFAEKLFVYAIGRGLVEGDAPAIRRVVDAATPGGHRFSSYVLGIVASDAFGRARGETAERRETPK